MRNSIISTIAACVFLASLHAHETILSSNPMILPFAGRDGAIDVRLVGDEPSPACQVTVSANAQSSGDSPLVGITPAGPQPAPEVSLTVHALRQPQGDSETVTVSGSWVSVGIPSPPCLSGIRGPFSFKVTVTRTTPVVTAVGNAASFATGGIVPGAIATLFGTNLTGGMGINSATSLPLPTTLAGTSVIINGRATPLIAVVNVNGQQQINFQIPWSLQSGSTTTLAVNDGVTGPNISVTVLDAQPGIFGYSVDSKTFGAILHANFQLVDKDHPATAGETVLVFCTGLGAVSSPPGDGASGTGQPTVVAPTATIGNLPAIITFSGLAPGFAGLYQVNVQVPSGVAAGDQPVVLSAKGVSSNPVLLSVR